MANGNSNPNINRGLNGTFPLSYMGVNPSSPAQTVFENRAPTPNDSKNYLLGTLWIWQTSIVNPTPPPPLTPASIWMLTALAQGQATWTQIFPALASGLIFAGDTGTAVESGGIINFKETPPAAGSSVNFSASGSTVTLNTSDSNHNTIIGGNAGNTSITSTFNTGLGTSALASLTSGSGDNIAVGSSSLTALLTGTSNIAIGAAAGSNYTGAESSNILMNSGGTLGESNVLRIGAATGTGADDLAKAFICGIDLVNVGSVATVVTEHSNQLGTAVITAGTGITVTPGANTITIAATGQTTNILITQFNTPGTFTWTKNAATQFIEIVMWGGGAGGGSGRRGASTAAGGGSGAGGSDVVYYSQQASAFSSSETVIVGAGGAGGAAVAVNNTNGNPGIAGGFSSIGTLTTPGSSNPGIGGTTGTTTGGTLGVAFTINGTSVQGGGNGGSGGSSTGGNGASNTTQYGASGGGGGSGADSGTARQAGNGGSITTLNTVTTLIAGAAGGIESGTINGANGTAQITTHGSVTGGGGGGGGGGQSTGGVAGIGGNGAFPGGGGGGGGGSINGTNSGAGGNGSGGAVWIYEYF